MIYRRGAEVPLVPELDRHGLLALPVTAFFDQEEARPFNDGWVDARGHARASAEAVLAVLDARGLVVTDDVRARVRACRDVDVLGRWLARAATAPSGEAFVVGMG